MSHSPSHPPVSRLSPAGGSATPANGGDDGDGDPDRDEDGAGDRAAVVTAAAAAASRFDALACPALLGAILALVFAPALTFFYGYNDDFHMLWAKLHGQFAAWANIMTEQGRPLAGLFWALPGDFPRDINRLAAVRALGLASVWLLACLQFRHLWRRLHFPAPLACGLALATVLTPACALFVSWAMMWMFPLACAAAYGAGVLAWEGGRSSPGSLFSTRGVGRHLGIGLLLLAALATYQPAGPFFMVAVVAGLLSRQAAVTGDSATDRFRRVLRCTLVFLAWTILYFVTYKILLAWLPTALGPSMTERAALATDPGDKLRFLAGPVLWCALTSWTRLQPADWLQLAAAALVLVGCFGAILGARGPARTGGSDGGDERWRHRAVFFGGFVLALGAAVGPLVVVKENIVALRTLPAVYAILALVALVGWQEILGAAFSRFGRARLLVRAGALALPLLFAAAATRHHVLHGIVQPSHDELVALRREIRQRASAAGSLPARIVYLFPSPTAWRAPRHQPFAEFGVRSSPLSWVTPAFLRLLLEEEFGPQAGTGEVEIFSAPEPVGARDWFIDGIAAVDGSDGITTRRLPQIGEVRAVPNGWCFSPWLGAFDASAFPFINHPRLGWIFCNENPDASVWFHHARLEWLGTTPKMFPEFWFMKAGARPIRPELKVTPQPRWIDVQTHEEVR